MPVHDGARQGQKALATAAGKTTAQAGAMSGADLMQARDAAVSGTAVGPGVDGARYEQIKGGTGA